MDYITYEIARILYNLGFTFKFRQTDPDGSMVFYKNGEYFQIGGDLDKPLSDEARKLLEGSTWIPSQGDLMRWLDWNDFSYSITVEGGRASVECTDTVTGRQYACDTGPVEFALAHTIKKILKRREREFDTKTPEDMGIIKIDIISCD